MADIRDYINISPSAKTVIDIFTNAEEFASKYQNIFESERKSYLRSCLNFILIIC